MMSLPQVCVRRRAILSLCLLTSHTGTETQKSFPEHVTQPKGQTLVSSLEIKILISIQFGLFTVLVKPKHHERSSTVRAGYWSISKSPEPSSCGCASTIASLSSPVSGPKNKTKQSSTADLCHLGLVKTKGTDNLRHPDHTQQKDPL